MTEDRIDCDPNDEHHDAYRWIADNPIETDEQHREERKQARRKASSSSEGKTIPPILTWDDMMSDLETNGLPPELIEGVLHKGCRACISGSSKAGKTWTLVNLAVAAASGSEWLGRPTIESKTLYLDFELQRSFAQQRFKWVREKLQADERLVKRNLAYWNLRGNREPLEVLIDHLTLEGRKHEFDLIILDPYYKIARGFDENAAAEVAEVMSLVEDFSQATGAAFVYSHHFSKGNKADVDAIDRASGSGVFARDPDSIVTMTKHEEPDCLTLEATLRNHPPLDPTVLEFSKESFPTFIVRNDLDPENLKAIGKRKEPDHNILELIPPTGEIPLSNWKEIAEARGIPNRTFERLKKNLVDEGKVSLRETPGRGSPKMVGRAELIDPDPN